MVMDPKMKRTTIAEDTLAHQKALVCAKDREMD
jgi:hypothetical protein